MKSLLIAASMIVLSACSASAQSGWKHLTEHDQLHDRVEDSYVISGTYLTPPRIRPASPILPAMYVVCVAGKVKQNFIDVGAVVNSDSRRLFPVQMEDNIDGKRGALMGNAVSTDGTAVYFTRDDLAKLLKSHSVIIGVDEYLGPEIVIRFNMPDPTPLLAGCSSDRMLKYYFKKKRH